MTRDLEVADPSTPEVILETISAGVVAIDRSGRVSYANRAAQDDFAPSGGRLIGAPWTTVLPHFGEASEVALGKALGKEWRFEATLPGHDESVARSVGMTLLRAEPPSAEVEFVVLMRCLDKVAALEIERQRNERLAALGRLVGGLAHELRNPLAALHALADSLFIELRAGDPRAEYATRILEAVGRMEGFVRAAVRFAQPERGELATNQASELLGEALRLAELPGPAPDVEWLCEPQISSRVARRQIAECLAALLRNAHEASGHGKGVLIRVGRHTAADGSSWQRFDIVDDGPGVPDELHTRIFEPFYSTKPARFGMGLAIAQRNATGHGGRIELSSTPGRGCTFSLCLPEATR